jgi:hypothetical protein
MHLVIMIEMKLVLENKCIEIHTGFNNQVSVHLSVDLHPIHHQRHPKGYECI